MQDETIPGPEGSRPKERGRPGPIQIMTSRRVKEQDAQVLRDFHGTLGRLEEHVQALIGRVARPVHAEGSRDADGSDEARRS